MRRQQRSSSRSTPRGWLTRQMLGSSKRGMWMGSADGERWLVLPSLEEGEDTIAGGSQGRPGLCQRLPHHGPWTSKTPSVLINRCGSRDRSILLVRNPLSARMPSVREVSYSLQYLIAHIPNLPAIYKASLDQDQPTQSHRGPCGDNVARIHWPCRL